MKRRHLLIALAGSAGVGSFVSKYWRDMYLDGRWGLAANSNPGVVLREEAWDRGALNGGIIQGQCERAAHLVSAVATFARDVELERIAPDSFRGMPCDASQYENMFFSTRIPVENGSDELRKSDASCVSHILVFCRSSAWKVDVVDQTTGDLLPPEAIAGLLRTVRRCADDIECDDKESSWRRFGGIRALTGIDRDLWGRARASIEAQGGNAAAHLQVVDEAAFVLHLDEGSSSHGSFEESMRAALLGYPGSTDGPRWFDKSI